MKRIILASIALLSLVAQAQDGTVKDPSKEAPKHANLNGTNKFTAKDGEGLFKTVCAECHMPTGLGGTAASSGYPALAKNEKLAASAYPVMMVMNGHGAMPSFKGQMDDGQVAAVVIYVRTHFGNNYADAVSLDEVKQVRDAK